MMSSRPFILLGAVAFLGCPSCSSNNPTSIPSPDAGGDAAARDGGDPSGPGDEATVGDPAGGDARTGDTASGDNQPPGDPGPGACLKTTEPCTDDAQCCNGSCVAGAGVSMQCAEPSGCTTRYETCVSVRQCCSGTCADDASGAMTCMPIGGCTPMGDICSVASTSSTECCSGICELDGTVLRCTNTAGCQHPGELCGEGASNNCCDPSGSGNDGSTWCVTTSDIDRCTGYHCTGAGCTGCFAAGVACATPEDCCSSVCLPSVGGPFTCDGS